MSFTLMARKKKRRNIERERAFLENGSRVLEKLIVSCNGRPTPIRSFSCEEIERATNNYDPRRIFHRDLLYEWYNGSFEGRMVSIKKYLKNFHEAVFTDIAISTKMSPHNNVLRLIGCCLETQIPTLVYESAANGSLAYRWEVSNSSLHGEQQQREPMAWQSKLKIAKEIAHAIAYLHTAFSRPIIHRDIKQGNIFIDEHDVAKLTDFSQSISIPEGETHIVDKHVIGTLGFVCPYYATTLRITEKIDVFSFGSFLLELTTGQRICHLVETADDEGMELEDYIENVTINEIVNLEIQAGERGAVVDQQAQAVKLALLCREKDPEIRPNMVDVTKELRKIERLVL
ncbi:serine/threonine-protein kinase ZRK1-like [Castanea sativa]|uniref:serine/threonine-protein kinase ZRK1-like n=1 Tax=Castanea sativa TaxID=21020 RepID=UPI003F64F8C1